MLNPTTKLASFLFKGRRLSQASLELSSSRGVFGSRESERKKRERRERREKRNKRKEKPKNKILYLQKQKLTKFSQTVASPKTCIKLL